MLAVVLWVLICPGCNSHRPPAFQPHLKSEILERASRDLKHPGAIRCKGGHLTAQLTDEKGSHRYDLDMTLLYQAPRRLYVSGKVIIEPQIYIRSNNERYWLELTGKHDKLYWGYWKNADRECNTWRIAGPNRLVEALGQIDLSNLAGKYIGPFMQRRPPYHVFIYGAVDDKNDWYFAKEICLTVADRVEVSKIVYRDANGDIELEINFDDYRNVGSGDGESWYLAHKIELNWPGRNSYLKLNLGRITIPANIREQAFEFPDIKRYKEEDVEQVDRDCKN